MNKKQIMGTSLAIGAAMANGLVGVFSKAIFVLNLSPIAVSFYKCFIAFLVLTVVIFLSPQLKKKLFERVEWGKIAICAFLGIFVLYFFETTAYNDTTVSVVVFILLGTSAMVTFLFSTLLLSEKKYWPQYVGFVLLLIGLAVMIISGESKIELSSGVLIAAIAGIGYGLFLVLTKKFDLNGGLVLLWYLIGFGTIYLFVPFVVEGLVVPQKETWMPLLALAVIPTLGGFYCTVKALSYIQASRVQLLELTEPIFATVFAFILLQELVDGYEWLGASLILIAIYVSEWQRTSKRENKRIGA